MCFIYSPDKWWIRGLWQLKVDQLNGILTAKDGLPHPLADFFFQQDYIQFFIWIIDLEKYLLPAYIKQHPRLDEICPQKEGHYSRAVFVK